ncbi:Tad domain-containing protein [Novosphingobium flavum]|uniref:Tad domain-containing protein n=1 Tax=Novosphingobium flavum TaxID=1778672 RepID=A0A7X1FV04_9SPHN|nr:Tad domain-containing protein [Novosphingobium flavum]MBC2667344.1 Tad domain-containing protein [Novosphingobium flavum]
MVNLLRKLSGAGRGTFLARLAADRAGNVLALVAACIPPILILVGGGIDMSRAYMAQTALQNACDAGVLAGRRASAKSGTFGTTEQGKASRMFNFNFNGTSQSANATGTTFTPTDTGSGVISATATTTVPTTIMKIFGTNNFALSASCSAEFQISNIDVMMVLDTTGSMACKPDGTSCDSGSTSKIEGLKSAIRSFYYTIAAAVPTGGTTRVRFGFVPYAGTVNMKNLVSAGDIPQAYLASANNYQTKLYKFDKPNYTATTGTPSVVYETLLNLASGDCDSYANNDYPSSGSNPATSGTAPSNVTTITYSLSSWTKTATLGTGRDKINIGICIRKVSTAVTSYTLSSYSLSNTPYRYAQSSVDTSSIKLLSAVNLATGVNSNSTVPALGYTTGYYDPVALAGLAGTSNVTSSSYTWTGCIEERSTVNSLIDPTAISASATDLDVTSAPTTTASTQWKPYVSNLVFDRGQSATLDTSSNIASMTEYCVPAAQKLTTVDTTNKTTVPSWVETYLGTLYAWGGTYHDIGMIWGARLANPSGIMATNVNSGNLTSVSRHIIFLTDGEMSPYCSSLYSAYGLEYLDHRVAPATASTGTSCDSYLKPYHNARYLAACQRAKDMGYTVWVIGFGQSLTTEMTSCASSGRAYYASDTSTLQTTFRTIAAQVADLRLKS